MSLRPIVAAAALALASLTPVAGVAVAAADPCAVTWADPAGDTTYGLGVAVALADDDLDATKVVVRATATDVVATVTVKHLDRNGPTYGTGHGMGFYLTKNGTTVSLAARVDATYGDKAHGPVRLTLDPKANTFALTVSRADLAKLTGAKSAAGVLTGIGANTLRNDQVGGTGDMVSPSQSVGTSADTTSPGGDGATLSLDACDVALHRAKPLVPPRVGSVVSDGFTMTGLAGSQAVIRLTRETGPPGQAQHGPAVTLTASKGEFAGLALVGVSNGWYDTVVRTLGGETYDTDSDTNVAYDRRLPAGLYRVVLLGAPGAKVTATVQPSSTRVKPVHVPVAATATPQVAPTTDVGTGQRAQGSWSRQQIHRNALVGVVHIASLQYGNAVSYSLACPGHSKVGTASLSSDGGSPVPPGPVSPGMAWTTVSTTHIAFGPSTAIETDVGGSWSGQVQAATATQRGFAVYLPLVVP